jgi:hypothetical protein
MARVFPPEAQWVGRKGEPSKAGAAWTLRGKNVWKDVARFSESKVPQCP